MKLYRLETEQKLAISAEAAWDFFSDPSKLAEITPPSMGFEVSSELPPRMYAGMVVCYRVKPLFGVSVSWVTEITQVEEPRYFVDEQRLGPYRFWHHEHHFREVPGGVLARDLVHYALPPVPGAALAGRWLVAAKLREIFGYRRRVLAERFGAPPK